MKFIWRLGFLKINEQNTEMMIFVMFFLRKFKFRDNSWMIQGSLTHSCSEHVLTIVWRSSFETAHSMNVTSKLTQKRNKEKKQRVTQCEALKRETEGKSDPRESGLCITSRSYEISVWTITLSRKHEEREGEKERERVLMPEADTLLHFQPFSLIPLASYTIINSLCSSCPKSLQQYQKFSDSMTEN